MGCIQVTERKCKNEERSSNGKFTNPNRLQTATEVDSILPLNVRQIFKLKQSWKAIKRKSTDAGVEMFIR